jgi:hypothetical protein
MHLTDAITFLKEPANAYLLAFSKFPKGPNDAIERIPSEQPGIYFWFRTFQYPIDHEGFAAALTKDLNAPKFPTRVGQIQPYYEVSLASASYLGTKKTKALEQAMKSAEFRNHIRQLLSLSILLQAPLYIGKSKNIKRRIDEHLSDDSLLSKRLEEHGLRIQDTALLVVPMDGSVDLNLPGMDDELLYEEIFSRLFNPLFNLRLG